ncbi:MAG: hypothetical protein WC389_12870 [Lutibacter sp.]
MKGYIWRIIFAALVIVGCVALWKFGGVDDAVKAQSEVKDKGYYYFGETWMSVENFNELESSLAKRDSSLQTRTDLVVLPEVNDSGELKIRYEFFSIENYEGLNKTRDFPVGFAAGFAISTGVAPILFFVVAMIWAFSILFNNNKTENKETENAAK